jgi:glyoxylase-like metal-dependent hydrolase (beta-lactamase superfamily II)
MKHLIPLALAGLLASAPATAHDAVSLAELAEAFGWDFENAEITTEKVGDHLYVLFGIGGNIAVSIGDQGVLIVDDQFPELIPRIKTAIAELGGGDVDFAINTHWHFDHSAGNATLGSDGTWLVSHLTSREMLLDNHLIDLVSLAHEQEASPPEALPVITYDERMQFFFNDERIDLVHFGPAHTTGDTAVIFRTHNAVHMGDVYNNSGYPFIDAGNGGTLDGVIEFCTAVLAEIDDNTVVIPGHGPVATYSDLRDYVSMLETIRERIAALIDRGASLDDVIAAKPTAEWDEAKGDPVRLLDRAYESLTRN